MVELKNACMEPNIEVNSQLRTGRRIGYCTEDNWCQAAYRVEWLCDPMLWLARSVEKQTRPHSGVLHEVLEMPMPQTFAIPWALWLRCLDVSIS
jgi:hypothetical protein